MNSESRFKFQKENGRIISFNGIEGVAYTSVNDCEAGDIAVLKVDGRHGKIKTTLSDRFHFVIEEVANLSLVAKIC